MVSVNMEALDKKPRAADITPDTKVGKMLENFPDLEATLFELSPSFKKLRNPILRKTIGRVATLRQAAEVGNISLGMMINTLRKAAGLQEISDVAHENFGVVEPKPGWLESVDNMIEFDARPIIESGDHPLNVVVKKVHELEDDQVLKLITPFVPVPLIDVVKGQGFAAWSEIIDPDTANTYFKR